MNQSNVKKIALMISNTLEGKSWLSVIKQIEKELVRMAAGVHPHNKSAAAKLMNLNRTTFIMKLKKYGFKLNQPSAKKLSDIVSENSSNVN